MSFLPQGSPSSEKAVLYLYSLRTFMVGSAPVTGSPAGCIPRSSQPVQNPRGQEGGQQCYGEQGRRWVASAGSGPFSQLNMGEKDWQGYGGYTCRVVLQGGSRTFIYSCMYINMYMYMCTHICINIKGPDSYFGNSTSRADIELH